MCTDKCTDVHGKGCKGHRDLVLKGCKVSLPRLQILLLAVTIWKLALVNSFSPQALLAKTNKANDPQAVNMRDQKNPDGGF